MQQYLKITS